MVRPVKRTLFGDAEYKGASMQGEGYGVAPIGTIMSDVCRLPDDAWTDYAFMREPLNGRLNERRRHEFMALAQACGTEWARRLSTEFRTSVPARIAEGLGVSVEYRRMPHGQDRVLFAEFVEPDGIYLYEDALGRAQELLSQPEVREAVGPKLRTRSLLIGHEVFHAVELRHQDEMWTETFRIDTLGLGPFHNRSCLVVLSEIAAMAFARTLLDLPYSSYVMDILMTYAYSPKAGTSLYDEVMGYQRSEGAGESPSRDGNARPTDAPDEGGLTSLGSLAGGILGGGLPGDGGGGESDAGEDE